MAGRPVLVRRSAVAGAVLAPVLTLGLVDATGAVASPVATAATVSASAPTLLPVASRPVLRRGSRGVYVKLVQKALGVRQTGYFGTRTYYAVRAFQRAHHLRVTGVVGRQTWVLVDRRLAAMAAASRSVSTTDPTMTYAARTSATARALVTLTVWKASPHGHAIVARESGGRCTAVSPTGLYRGKWQMSSSLWKGYGGLAFAATADRATCAQQDQVAYKVWRAQWWRPWGG